MVVVKMTEGVGILNNLEHEIDEMTKRIKDREDHKR